MASTCHPKLMIVQAFQCYLTKCVDEAFDSAEAAPAQTEAQPDALMRTAKRAGGGAGWTERLNGTEGDAASVRLPVKFQLPRRGDIWTCWFKDKSYEAYRTFNSDHVRKVSMSSFAHIKSTSLTCHLICSDNGLLNVSRTSNWVDNMLSLDTIC